MRQNPHNEMQTEQFCLVPPFCLKHVMPAMKASEVDQRLRDEGCNPSTYSVFGSSHDAWCLDSRGGQWVVFYSERGIDSPPIFSGDSEEGACEFFSRRFRPNRTGILLASSDTSRMPWRLKLSCQRQTSNRFGMIYLHTKHPTTRDTASLSLAETSSATESFSESRTSSGRVAGVGTNFSE